MRNDIQITVTCITNAKSKDEFHFDYYNKEGNIVGWLQDASEIGPRALGNRSILCLPYPYEMKDILNNLFGSKYTL